MKRRPRDIGTAGETAACRFLLDDGWPDCERTAQAGALDRGDLTVCREPRIIAEVKSGAMAETASAANIADWLAQTETERANAAALLGVLIVRRFRRPVRLWDAWMTAADWAVLIDGADPGGMDAPWPLRSSLADWSAMAKGWAYA